MQALLIILLIINIFGLIGNFVNMMDYEADLGMAIGGFVASLIGTAASLIVLNAL